MSAAAIYTLGGWEVRLHVDPDDGWSWMTPAEARDAAAAILAAADVAERNAAAEAALPLRERVLSRLTCCAYHVAGGLAKLLGEDEPAVAAALAELERAGEVRLFHGRPGFYTLSGGVR